MRVAHYSLLMTVTAGLFFSAGCSDLSNIGREPDFTPLGNSNAQHAIYSTPMPRSLGYNGPTNSASLWNSKSPQFFGAQRASQRGDIITVVIEIDDSAKITNSTGRARTGSSKMGIPQFFGIPQRIDEHLPEGASMAQAVDTHSNSSFNGSGNVTRSEKLTLRVAATIVEQLPNGIFRIEGQQEVRVNFEMRELVVRGFVRPNDITRQNEISYDRIAGAQISYGGRGQLSEVQQPRYGQQITDVLLPF